MKEKAVSYEDTEIYKLGVKLQAEINTMTLTDLPSHERFEESSQIRRSSKAVVANFVEGYGMRRYKAEFLYRLTKAISENDETKAHLDMLFRCESLPQQSYEYFHDQYRRLGGMLYNFRDAVDREHRSPK